MRRFRARSGRDSDIGWLAGGNCRCCIACRSPIDSLANPRRPTEQRQLVALADCEAQGHGYGVLSLLDWLAPLAPSWATPAILSHACS